MSRLAKLGTCYCLICVALLFNREALAHHSFAGTYSPETITIEGNVVEFLFRSPHSAVLVETRGEEGKTITWAAEWGTAGQLSRQGIEKDTIKPGDHVIVKGNPSRNSADHRLRLEEITRPSDGWAWKSNFY